MKIYDRAAGQYCEEREYGWKSLKFLYGTAAGRVLLKIFFCRGIYSKLNGAFMKSPISVYKIRPFIKKYGIDLSRCGRTDFKSFDDFFTRKCAVEASCSEDGLISSCCGRLTVYAVDEKLALKIKGSVYTLNELTGGNFELSDYGGGVCFLYRLVVEDCHRYIFFDDGEVVRSEEIKGVLHTVRSVSENFRVFLRNHRVCTLLRTKRFGDVIQIEVGALQVGKITNHDVTDFSRLDEKGFFSFGGSTIIQLFKKSVVSVDEDIKKYSECGVEVLVKTGERIARRTKCLKD